MGASMISTCELVINGTQRTVRADDRTPLLYILRNELDLKGTRFGCGMGECGTCTVLIDGRAEFSCQLPLAAAAGRRITTIEGLGQKGDLHPLQQAFIDCQAGQCGYCMSGIIMAALPLLALPQEPTTAAICDALQRNLCRCGAHGRMIKAIKKAWHDAKNGAQNGIRNGDEGPRP
jgi:nicotinate dehydrogenase subunit A